MAAPIYAHSLPRASRSTFSHFLTSSLLATFLLTPNILFSFRPTYYLVLASVHTGSSFHGPAPFQGGGLYPRSSFPPILLQVNFVPIYKVNKSWEVDLSHLFFHILYIERIFYERNLTPLQAPKIWVSMVFYSSDFLCGLLTSVS